MSRRILGKLLIGPLLAAALGAASCGGSDHPAGVTAATATTDASAVHAGDLTISGAAVRTTANDVSALYFTVDNSGPADRLLAVRTSVTPATMLHQDVTQGATSGMQMLDSLDVPAHGRLVLKPGTYHVMLMDLHAPLTVGMTITAVLAFEKAGSVTITVPVKGYADDVPEAATPTAQSHAH